MNRSAVRTSCAALAAAATLGFLKAITRLAAHEGSSPAVAIEAPRVEVTATRPVLPVNVVARKTDVRRM